MTTTTRGVGTIVQAVRVLKRIHGPLAYALRYEILGDAEMVAMSECGVHGGSWRELEGS